MLRTIISQQALFVPWLWRCEIANALLVRERRRLIDADATVKLVRLVDELGVRIIGEPDHRSLISLITLARPHQLTAYDAIYLDTAVRLNLSLLTLDKNLIAAANRLQVPLAL